MPLILQAWRFGAIFFDLRSAMYIILYKKVAKMDAKFTFLQSLIRICLQRS